jgi:membrane protein DedA with SNARE-associated domain
VFDSILDAIANSNWTYALVFGLSFGDVLFPLLPAETSVIAAGVLAASGDLNLALIIVVAAVGAILGDNTAYWIGRLLKGPVQNRLFSGDKRRHLDRAERGLQDRGGTLIFIGRFIPGGRSAVTFGAGVLEYSYPRFLCFDVIAGILWASYAGLIGYIGGEAFEESPVKGILLALAIAFFFAGLLELVRWLRRRQVDKRASVAEPVSGDDVG